MTPEDVGVLLARHRISDIGLATLPVKTVIDHDLAAIEQRQDRIANDLRLAARHGCDRLVPGGFKPELLENVAKRALGTIGVAFGQEEAIVQAVVQQAGDDGDKRN